MKMKHTSLVLTRCPIQAGDTLVLNATGVMTGSVTGGVGEIDAYLFGSEMCVGAAQRACSHCAP